MLARNSFRVLQCWTNGAIRSKVSAEAHLPVKSLGSMSIHAHSFSSGVFKSISKLFGGRTTIGNARSLLFNCKNQADDSLWHSRGLIGTDFRSKQILIMLHIWMVHKRLIQLGKDGLLLQEALFDELWEDTANRIRGHGINELSLNKYLKEVQGYSFRCCIELDHALSLYGTPPAAVPKKVTDGSVATSKDENATTSPIDVQHITSIMTAKEGAEVDPEQRREAQLMDEFGGVLWRLAYLRRDEVEVEHVLEFARYVRQEQLSLVQLPADAIFQGRIQWGPLPSWKNSTAATGTSSNHRKKHHKTTSKSSPSTLMEEKGEWKEATAEDGRVYYWNTVTRESRWEKPSELEEKSV